MRNGMGGAKGICICGSTASDCISRWDITVPESSQDGGQMYPMLTSSHSYNHLTFLSTKITIMRKLWPSLTKTKIYQKISATTTVIKKELQQHRRNGADPWYNQISYFVWVTDKLENDYICSFSLKPHIRPSKPGVWHQERGECE